MRRSTWFGRTTRSYGWDAAHCQRCEVQTLVSMFLEQMLPALGPDVDPGHGFDDLLSYLPLRLQDFVKTLRCIVDSLRRAFAILKYCRGNEVRTNYHVLCAGVACELVAEGDRSGMARKVTEFAWDTSWTRLGV